MGRRLCYHLRIRTPNDKTKKSLEAILKRLGVRRTQSHEVAAEVQAFEADPGIDDPSLLDLTNEPFITIDNIGSRDLDQALLIRRDGDGFVVDYALADASHSVRPGTALFKEALLRGATFYLPGFAVPMLPRALSENLVSLNPDVDRRALLIRMALDKDAKPQKTELLRARIRSRGKLTYEAVEAWYDGDQDAFAGAPFIESLELLQVVGVLRIQDQIERDVVQHHRRSTEVDIDNNGDLCIVQHKRRKVDRYNEQISLLCNIEGARFLRRRANPDLQPVFKVHDKPPAARVKELEMRIRGIVTAHALNEKTWVWRPRHTHVNGESLADYLERLPLEGPHRSIALAIHRQSIWINRRSEFAEEVAPHYGIGAEEYARFSAPMREIVGIFTHKEALDALDGERSAETIEEDRLLQHEVVEVSNRAKAAQSRINKESEKLALDAILNTDLTGDRPARKAMVMGLARSKVYLDLVDPPLEIKLYVDDLAKEDVDRPTLSEDGAVLSGPNCTFRIGDELRVRVRDHQRGRWSFDAVP